MITISKCEQLFQQEEQRQHHPWERFIKDAYANKIKTAHNSINNPHYPKKKEKATGEPTERVKFTVIGNRVTEEFIFCTNIVKGLHKYRKNHFECPVIRGVTNVDWPHVWNDLKIQYGGLAYCLRSQVVVFLNDKIIGGEKELKQLIEQKYTYHLSLDYYHESVAQFANFIKGSGRPTVYMHISINEEHIGTMIFMVSIKPNTRCTHLFVILLKLRMRRIFDYYSVFVIFGMLLNVLYSAELFGSAAEYLPNNFEKFLLQLYSDVVPYTCENFQRLCKAKKGGYSGTPVHRIVKDGWIQCGGFGLKSTNLDCENFIVPPDKRGVLCMANAGRHVDCSTQFFVLLQPSPWMLHKYVAFGQLIDGDATLRKIENVETYYESPTKNITIAQAGILNIYCQDIMINRGAHEYIHGHIEDLFALGEIIWEEIIARVFLEIQMRQNALLEALEADEEPVTQDLNLHATARFMKKGTAPNMTKTQKSKSQDESKSTRNPDQKPSTGEEQNNDFDVSEYQYEAEEDSCMEKHLITVKVSESIVVKPEKPYYIPLTDVPYPGEVSSEYDLKKYLRGDYCLETDLGPGDVKEAACIYKIETFPAEFFEIPSTESSNASEQSLDSDQEADIKKYLKHHTDTASFAGDIVRGISRAKHDHLILNPEKLKTALTDEELRNIKLVQTQRSRPNDDKLKKVSYFVPTTEPRQSRQIKRRQTGFVMPGNRKHENLDNTSDDSSIRRAVHMDPSLMASAPTPKISRRPTAYLRPGAFDTGGSDIAVMTRRSADKCALLRLLDDMDLDDDSCPTLKGMKSQASEQKSILLTRTKLKVTSDISETCEHYRTYLNKDTLKMIEKKQQYRAHLVEPPKNSLRAVAYAKTRPTMSVAEYQERNKQSKEKHIEG